ncbi:hypothetical protein [Paenibacillus methanolicus]|uniref:Uncharacterized protein n=1 Tax=Paenibacillus methanolicus TaxID=582686 RepID=A0A5S5CLN1_9BACL|nr:hypothetical protein [Paenibacillus methanolicus]TYP79421.1 hypothetical protein BCM02_101539 [Paenibacillus methanolicus]
MFDRDKVAQIHTVYGLFLVGTIWIFILTYRSFWIYMAANAAIDFIYAFGLRLLWKKLGITSGGNLPSWASYPMMLGIAVLLFGYQYWQEWVWSNPQTKRKVRITWFNPSFFKRRSGTR